MEMAYIIMSGPERAPESFEALLDRYDLMTRKKVMGLSVLRHQFALLMSVDGR